MTDIWHRDTREALYIFSNSFDEVRWHLECGYGREFDTLYSEVDGLLDQYQEKVKTIEGLEDKVRELESALQDAVQDSDDEEVFMDKMSDEDLENKVSYIRNILLHQLGVDVTEALVEEGFMNSIYVWCDHFELMTGEEE